MEQESNQTKAMVEVALALAMVFFSIMVLTMVSMGAGIMKPLPTTLPNAPLNIQSSAKYSVNQTTSNDNYSVAQKKDLIIWFKGEFFDSNLTPVDPESWKLSTKKPVLAVAANTDLQDLLNIRKIISIDDITITSLDERWRKRLTELTSNSKNTPN